MSRHIRKYCPKAVQMVTVDEEKVQKYLLDARHEAELSHMPKIRQLLKLYGVRAVKQLSQNFILDPQLSKRVVSGLGKNLHSNCILEVGAGIIKLLPSIRSGLVDKVHIRGGPPRFVGY
ncbi:hypothetical protein DI09_43p70 [Mitosporidium daphniae]|uniref:Uncharacterized protein n=1 Tax=Mitosporidium daphniae TaxID=1485682 RepID=A0A098VQ01_9MICR|nr:uncharacterized protein DI09_43p70 [Mitosporidium daphniae]KGG51132.1 hypothetical protein DI09_43p70 [Mitosporidium daphniae]|eukprot:XP_013237584.1 uncharacterized protein DI09_43p70 [Mitosporidium daphniae]